VKAVAGGFKNDFQPGSPYLAIHLCGQGLYRFSSFDSVFLVFIKQSAENDIVKAARLFQIPKCLLYLAFYKFTILEPFELLIGSVVQYFFKVISDHNRHF
jgi:hypothetical protein